MIWRVLAISIFFTFAHADDIGSDSVVNRFSIQQSIGDGDRIAGFAAIEKGFRLKGTTVTATFDSFLPVSGPIELNSGKLVLNRDLVFKDPASLVSFGSIMGNGFTVELSPSISAIPKGSDDGGGSTNNSDCMISLLGTFNFDRSVYSVGWSYDSLYLATGLNKNGDEFIINSWDGITLTQEASVDVAGHAFSVDWHPSKDFIAVGRQSGLGAEIYMYSFNRITKALTLVDSIDLGTGQVSVFSVAWHPSGTHLAVATEDSTQEVIIYEVDTNGNFGSSITIDLAQPAKAVAWNPSGTFFIVGAQVGNSFDELRVYSFTAAPLQATLNASVNVGLTVNTVAWNPVNDLIAVGLDVTPGALKLYEHNSGGGTLTLQTTVNALNKVTSVDWHKDGGCLVTATETEFPEGESRSYKLKPDNSLVLVIDFEIGNDVFCVDWGPNGSYVAAGDKNHNICVFRRDADFVDPNRFVLDNVTLLFNANVTLKDSFVILTGDCILNGRGITLTLDSTTTILIDSSSTVKFQDLIIKGLSDTQLEGVDGTSHIILDNVTFSLDQSYSFTSGCFDINNICKIIGNDFSFIYNSSYQTFVRKNSSLELMGNVIFDYDPLNLNPSLLSFTDSTSKLILNNATFKTTGTGVILTKGMLDVQSDSSLSTNSLGITLGSQNQADDFLGFIKSGATLSIDAGVFNYKNIKRSSWKMVDVLSRMTFKPNTQLCLFEDIYLDQGIFAFRNNTLLKKMNGKNIKGSIHIFGNLTRQVVN